MKEIVNTIINSQYIKVIIEYLILMVPIVVIHEMGHIVAVKSIDKGNLKAIELGWGGLKLNFTLKDEVKLIIHLPLIICGKTKTDNTNLEGDPNQNWKLFWISIAGPLFQFLFMVFTVMLIAIIKNPDIRTILVDSVMINFLTLIVQLLPLKKANTDGFKAVACLWYSIKGVGIYDDRNYRIKKVSV